MSRPPAPGLRSLDPNTAVLVGVGEAAGGAEATELMARAVEAAAIDAAASAGTAAVLAAVDRMSVPQGTWTYPDPARLVAARVGATGARTHLVELGIPQQSLVSDALAAIAGGRSEVAVVVGGEAKRWARHEAASGHPVETAQPGVGPDVTHARPGPVVEDIEVATRLWEPVQQYAMIENVLRATDGRTLDEHAAEVADLWARFNEVAQGNPRAAFPAPRDADRIARSAPDNRPLAFPYRKWHSSQWTVDQAASLLLCSVEAAGRLGIPSDRWVFPLVSLESSHAVSLLRRRELATWPAMAVLGRAASGRIDRPLDGIDVVELYSCFPAAVRVQQRELGLDPRGTPTVTGGMAFAGGPFNNFVLQSTAPVVRALRRDPGSVGMVTTVSGLLTKPGIGIWSARPDGHPPLVADLAAEAEAVTPTAEVVASLDGYRGPAVVATYTVTYDGLDPVRTVVLGDLPDGRRAVAFSEDRALAARAVSSELVGVAVEMEDGGFVLG